MEEILSSILESAIALGWTQWLAFAFSLAYVILAAKESIWCWFFGLIGVVLAFVVYVEYNLYSEALLQIYYAVVSIYGWWAWRQQESNHLEVLDVEKIEKRALSISTWSVATHGKAIVLGIVLGIAWGFFWSHFGAAMPYVDAFIATFSVIATYMVTQKILENWIYWIIIDFCCIFLYIHRGIYLFALLFLVYCIVAIFGYIRWREEWQLVEAD